MHRSYPNVSPVSNKYLGHKLFLKAQAEHEHFVSFSLLYDVKFDRSNIDKKCTWSSKSIGTNTSTTLYTTCSSKAG